MKSLNIYCAIIIIFIQACKKPYDDPPVQSGISNLVVDCTITNDPPPYTLSLTKSVGYNSTTYPPRVTNAKIYIEDDLGNLENVIESPAGSGNYLTSATGMRGEIGRSYKLFIALTNTKGVVTSKYESDWERLKESPVVDSIYAQIGQVESLLEESDGSFVTNTIYGLDVFVNAKPPKNQDYYYKFKSSFRQQYSQNFYTGSTGRYSQPANPPTVLYGWSTSVSTPAKNLKSGAVSPYIPINGFYAGFIPQFVSSVSDSFVDAPTSAGAVTTIDIYSVSKIIYQIYTEENSQTAPDNTLFDPTPTQLETNIKCTSDSGQNVLGYFSAASVKHNYHFFLWVKGEKNINSFNIDTIPSNIPSLGVDSTGVPYFWVNSYGMK
jgi:hypothetical protein